MIMIDKKIEYTLIILKYMKDKNEMISARDISDKYLIPFDTVAKIMKILNNNKIIVSKVGNKGGSKLNNFNLDLLELNKIVKGNTKFIKCIGDECDIKCNIKSLIKNLNLHFENFLSSIKIQEIL